MPTKQNQWKRKKKNKKFKLPPLVFLSQVLHSIANERERKKIKISGSKKLYITKHLVYTGSLK